MDDSTVIAHTRRWVADFVIGLNLCPFARRVFEGDKVRYVVSASESEAALLEELTRELHWLADPKSNSETTFLIHPHALNDFLAYNDFLDVADSRIDELDLEGVIQIASFHPRYRFADTDADAVENYTNRSPYPMLHLLREESISAVAGDTDELLEIPRRNIQTLEQLGAARILEMLEEIRRAAV